jgi:hypothetical protein
MRDRRESCSSAQLFSQGGPARRSLGVLLRAWFLLQLRRLPEFRHPKRLFILPINIRAFTGTGAGKTGELVMDMTSPLNVGGNVGSVTGGGATAVGSMAGGRDGGTVGGAMGGSVGGGVAAGGGVTGTGTGGSVGGVVGGGIGGRVGGGTGAAVGGAADARQDPL